MMGIMNVPHICTNKSGCVFGTPAPTHLAPSRALEQYQTGQKTCYLIIHDIHKISCDKWIMVANRLQTIYGGGLA